MTWGTAESQGWGNGRDPVASDVPARAANRIEALPPPGSLLLAAVVAAVAALVLVPLASELMHIIGWALGSLATIGLLTAFTAVDAKRSQSTRYVSIPMAGKARAVIAVAGLVAAVLHAFAYATKVAG
jgi:hypothetical protein